MKFDKPRVFEYVGRVSSLTYRVEFQSDEESVLASRSDGGIGILWTLPQVIEDMNSNRTNPWREITEVPPPFGITTLDCVGVFEPEPAKEPDVDKCPVCRHRAKTIAELRRQLAEQTERHPDIAEHVLKRLDKENRELRARVTELEATANAANARVEIEYQARCEAATKKIEHYDNCMCELRRQLQSAYMRLDYATADRIADLIGDKRPSDHEATNAEGAAV